MGHPWTWYALALVGAYQLTAAGFDAIVRRVVRIASQAKSELRSAKADRPGPPAPEETR